MFFLHCAVQLSVISSAGSYIKELVHGDFDRTVPSLKSILDIETDILALGRHVVQ
jgi:tRNA pseudouridine synthase 10